MLVTGGAGFIGSHLVDALLTRPNTHVTVLDIFTYAGSRTNLAQHSGNDRLAIAVGDVADAEAVAPLVQAADRVIHAAAETHVDRSIAGAAPFLSTNVVGTQVMLEACRDAGTPMVMVSTDEVYGSNRPGAAPFEEEAPLRPRSPYAASKAAADLLCAAWVCTYETPVTVVRGTNAYGPRQFPEKVIPVYATAAIDGRPLPVYGRGEQCREWLHVTDWVAGCLAVMDRGALGAVYNIGGGFELANVELARRICALVGASEERISFVADRPGHDFRYGVTSARLRSLGWAPSVGFDEGLAATVAWYADHRDWVAEMLAGAGGAG